MNVYYGEPSPALFSEKVFGLGAVLVVIPAALVAFSIFTYYKQSTALVKGMSPVFEIGPVIKYGKYAVPAGVVLMVLGVLMGARPWL